MKTIPLTQPANPAAATAPILPERYAWRGLIAVGGMGEVHRVWDRHLDRTLVLKQMLPHLICSTGPRARFHNESRITASLNHPGIVVVFDADETDDGRPYYTMREASGARTLRQVLGERTRALRAIAAAAEAVAWAHARGVIHRDLKPDNVLLDMFGGVLVIDWGIARRVDDAVTANPYATNHITPGLTRAGAHLGTPGYAPPEQAWGASEDHGSWSDVWALGATLYEVLAGRRPPDGAMHGDPVGLDDPLSTLVERCLIPDPTRRTTASALATELRAWLEGEDRRVRADQRVTDADTVLPERDHRLQRAAALRAAASHRLDALGAFAEEQDRLEPWAWEDEAAVLEQSAASLDANAEQLLHAALEIAPGHPGARGRLADRYADTLRRAEADRDPIGAARARALLATHDDGRHAVLLAGKAALTLYTDPPARALLYRYVPSRRRRVLLLELDLGTTPLRAVEIPAGSWLVELSAPGRPIVQYPVHVDPGEHWDSTRPGDSSPLLVQIPPQLDPDDCYVPPGPAWLGGDPNATDSAPRARRWLDGFIVRRFAVTVAEYLAFLDDQPDAERWAPRESAGLSAAQPPLMVRGPDGRHHPVPDGAGVVWLDHWPVTLIDWHAASAFCAWEAARSGLPWRLPQHEEREKAVRGVDGRCFPWGDHGEPTWSCNGQARPGPGQRAGPEEFPHDTSPYGVRHGAGNVRDWCLDAYQRRPPDNPIVTLDPPGDAAWRFLRGGAWAATAQLGRCATRLASRPDARLQMVGLRLCRSWP